MTKVNARSGGAPDLGRIKKLVALMREADLVELEIEASGTIKMRRREDRVRENPAPVYVTAPAAAPVAAVAAPAAAPAAAAAAPPPGPAPAAAAPEVKSNLVEFKSPIVGTFYRASSPDKEPFVEKGRRVRPETVICIIEAMKVMNEIRAEMSGEIVEILAKNGDAVEFGQPIFLIKP